MKRRIFRNRKAVELSINMLVIVALAVFALFLIIGFVLGGFDFFRKIFFGLSSQPEQVAQTKCQTDWQSYQNIYGDKAVDASSQWADKLCKDRFDVDFNGDGKVGEDNGEQSFNCKSYIPSGDVCGSIS